MNGLVLLPCPCCGVVPDPVLEEAYGGVKLTVSCCEHWRTKSESGNERYLRKQFASLWNNKVLRHAEYMIVKFASSFGGEEDGIADDERTIVREIQMWNDMRAHAMSVIKSNKGRKP